ncbi:MAG: hypothetical protein CVU43_12530 [Chloroflexi bacterium HGW-Chloroflexi-5]|jgi:hypothetical protein|nr:MAG: hypothetical protein CVU43_12530 [Chloroflexi bacterium HGW-Chloroflexi-5]PKP09834.1 MAG: hypothetical protein CVU09_09400 [Bacteroidetes bacterium HGW-Bacteroidetes-4]
MQEKNTQYVDLILQKVKLMAELDTDQELADLFGTRAGTISAWRNRNSINYDMLIKVCQEKGWDLNYILTVDNGNLNGNVNGNLNPNVHKKVTIKSGSIGQANNYGNNATVNSTFANEKSQKYNTELEVLKEQNLAQKLTIAKLEGQVELLKSLLNK